MDLIARWACCAGLAALPEPYAREHTCLSFLLRGLAHAGQSEVIASSSCCSGSMCSLDMIDLILSARGAGLWEKRDLGKNRRAGGRAFG